MTEQQNKCREEFEAWALLPPRLSIEKDGDGEYEDTQARWLYRAFEVGFRKGAWHGATNMQRQCELDYDKLAALSQQQETNADAMKIANDALLLAARWFKLSFDDETLEDHPPSKADLAGMFDAMQEARRKLHEQERAA